MEFEKIYSNIMKTMLYIVFLSTSYAAVFSSSYIDDIAVLGIGVLEIIFFVLKHEQLSKELALIGSIMVVQAVWLVVSMLIGSVSYAVQSFFVYIKIIIMFILPFTVELKKKDKFFRNLVIMSVPNIIYGLYEFYTTYVRHIYLPGKYDASGHYRLQGMTGHPIYYSLLLVILLVYLLYICNKKIRFVAIPICIIFLILTWSELALVGMLLVVGYKVFQYTKVKNIFIRYVSVLTVSLMVGLLGVIFIKMLGETFTIRYVSVMQTLKNVNFYNFIVGNGFGTYTEAQLSESYLFHVFYDSGIMGIILLSIILLDLYKKMMFSKNYVGIFTLSLYVVSMFINEGYMVPLIAFIPVLCGTNIDSKKRELYIVYE